MAFRETFLPLREHMSEIDILGQNFKYCVLNLFHLTKVFLVCYIDRKFEDINFIPFCLHRGINFAVKSCFILALCVNLEFVYMCLPIRISVLFMKITKKGTSKVCLRTGHKRLEEEQKLSMLFL